MGIAGVIPLEAEPPGYRQRPLFRPLRMAFSPHGGSSCLLSGLVDSAGPLISVEVAPSTRSPFRPSVEPPVFSASFSALPSVASGSLTQPQFASLPELKRVPCS